MGWKVVISPGTVTDPGAFTIDAKFKFDLQGKVFDNELGQVMHTEFHVEVEGDIVQSSASAVADSLLATMDQLKQYSPRNVYLVLDGTTKYTWTKTSCIGSPRVLAFRTVAEDGNASSHWRYAFTIYAKQIGNQGASELSTSILEVTEQGKLIKKVWRAYAKAGSVAQALAKVMSFKPADPTLHQEVERRFQDSSASAMWSWDIYKNFTITEEPVEYSGNGKNWVWDYAIGDGSQIPPAIMHRAANEATRIVIRGTVRATDKASVLAPPPHYNDNGGTLVRAEAEETRFFPTVDQADVKMQVWSAPYMEVWYWTGIGRPPAPNHSGHDNLAAFTNKPPDGAIAGQ